MVIFCLGFLYLFFVNLAGSFLHAMVLRSSTIITASPLCPTYSDLNCSSEWMNNDSSVVPEGSNETGKCHLEILAHQIKRLVCSGNDPPSACNETVQNLTRRGSLPSCIDRYVFRACPGNIPNSIPKKIRQILRKRHFSDRKSLLLKESFIEELQNNFGDLLTKFVTFYEAVEGLTKSGKSAQKAVVKEWTVREDSNCSDVGHTAIKTQSILSKVLCQADMVSAKIYLMEQDLGIISGSVMAYDNLLVDLIKLKRHSIHGIESLRCRLNVPFREKIPRLILRLQREQCNLNDHLGSPATKPIEKHEILSKVEEGAFTIMKILGEINQELKEVSHHLNRTYHSTVMCYGNDNQTSLTSRICCTF